MNSRSTEDLHPWLTERYNKAVMEWRASFPNDPQPFLTQTYRSFDVQNSLYDQGRSTPGKIVTNAKGGQSLHNYHPALAFDLAFKDADGEIHWEPYYFKRFASIISKMGVEWGGSWHKFLDLPHYQVPNFTWHDAAAGKVFDVS